MDKLIVSYKSERPKHGDSPKIEVLSKDNYKISLINKDTNKKEIVKLITPGEIFEGGKQWFTNWLIIAENLNNGMILNNNYNAKNKTVFIKIDAYALGDNIAWMPYIDEFRKKHNCTVICSTFFNFLFSDVYPEILFVKPNIAVKNVYAQYYIGALKNENYKYSPVQVNSVPLQKVASEILGLKFREIKTKIKIPENIKNRFDKKYICISEYASSEEKMWGINKWQIVVNFLNSMDYQVVVISKEKTKLINVIDATGNISLNERINDLIFSEFFIGVSSGLSWLAWSLNKKVLMISDGTPQFHEFKCHRIGGESLSEINFNQSFKTPVKTVINSIKKNLF